MKRANLTINKMDTVEGCKAYAQGSTNGLVLQVGDVVLSACVDGVECGTRVFQSVDVKDPNDRRKTLVSSSGIDLVGDFILEEILAVLD